jgi:DNA-binding NarL/FixJ family response regulator
MSIIRIAVVDDHELVRNAFSKTITEISREFVITIQCSNGMELMENLGTLPIEKRPHIILTDLNMPIMDGYETTLSVKQKFRKEINVIVFSTMEDRLTVGRLINAGASGFITKGITGAELIEALRIVANGGTYFKFSEA